MYQAPLLGRDPVPQSPDGRVDGRNLDTKLWRHKASQVDDLYRRAKKVAVRRRLIKASPPSNKRLKLAGSGMEATRKPRESSTSCGA